MQHIPPHPRNREALAAYQQVSEYGAAKFLRGENSRSAQQLFERSPFHHFVSSLEAISRAYYDGAKWIETLEHARLFDAWILQDRLLRSFSLLKKRYAEVNSGRKRGELWLTTRTTERIRVDSVESRLQGVIPPLEVLMSGVNQQGQVLTLEGKELTPCVVGLHPIPLNSSMDIVNPHTKEWETTNLIIIPVLVKPVVYDQNYRIRFMEQDINLKVADWESLIEITGAR